VLIVQKGRLMPSSSHIPLSKLVAETAVINPPQFPERRAASEVLCRALGLSPVRFTEGTTGLPHQLACTRAHRDAMQSLSCWPALVLEDDLQLTTDQMALAPLPPDADIIYLTVSPFGCLPWTRENLGFARHRALEGLTLASVHDADWLKVHSMSGAPAILYVTQKGRDAWVEATLQAERFGGPFDVFTAYGMKDVNVYAPHQPMFSEDGNLQRGSLRDNIRLLEQRLAFTRTPLKPYMAGDTTVVHFKGQAISVEAQEVETGRLQWNVLAVTM
jgi:hypothetical protein